MISSGRVALTLALLCSSLPGLVLVVGILLLVLHGLFFGQTLEVVLHLARLETPHLGDKSC